MNQSNGEQVKHGQWSFHKLTLKDKNLFDKYRQESEYPTTLWSSNFAYLWSGLNGEVLWRIVDDLLAVFILTKYKTLHLLCLPFGKGDHEKMINVTYQCLEYCRSWNGPEVRTRIRMINEPQLDFLKQSNRFTSLFKVIQIKGIERHFSVNKLLSLKGNEYKTVRRYVNKFHRLYPETVIRYYRSEDYDGLMELNEYWKQNTARKTRILDHFFYPAILKHAHALDQMIIVAENNDQIIGMCSGGILPNGEAWCSLRKAKYEFPGLSYVLFLELIKEIHKIDATVLVVNDGSDLGEQGLRQFKESLRPIMNYKRYQLLLR